MIDYLIIVSSFNDLNYNLPSDEMVKVISSEFQGDQVRYKFWIWPLNSTIKLVIIDRWRKPSQWLISLMWTKMERCHILSSFSLWSTRNRNVLPRLIYKTRVYKKDLNFAFYFLLSLSNKRSVCLWQSSEHLYGRPHLIMAR